MIGAPDPARPLRGKITQDALQAALTVKLRHPTQLDYARFFNLSRAMAAGFLLDPEYAGPLERYLDAYGAGRSMEDAAREFGDLSALADRINRRRGAVALGRIVLDPQPPDAITIRPMRDDEAAVFQLRLERLIEIRPAETARRLAALTRRYPDSALAWFEYAAAEYVLVQYGDFGGRPLFRGFGFANGELIVTANPYSDAEAWDAVNKALERDPYMAQARRLKAEILLSRLVRKGEIAQAEEYDEVRALLAPLARDPERHPLAATLYHQSWIEQGRDPPDAAFAQLARAFAANAGVGDFRYAYATALSRRGDKAGAQGLLLSMLNDPEFAGAALRALEAEP